MAKMTVGQLAAMLEGYDEDTEVHLAIQPSYPFEHSIDEITSLSGDGKVLYLAESGQLNYLPGEIRNDLGW